MSKRQSFQISKKKFFPPIQIFLFFFLELTQNSQNQVNQVKLIVKSVYSIFYINFYIIDITTQQIPMDSVREMTYTEILIEQKQVHQPLPNHPSAQRISIQTTETIESKLNKYDEFVLYLYESIAMLMYVYGQLCTNPSIGIDFQVSLLLFVGIPLTGYLSAGNFNSSITLAFGLCKFNRYSLRVLWIILKAHFFNAIIAQIVAYYLNDGRNYVALIADAQHTPKAIFFSEFMGTFALIYYVLVFANPKTTPLCDCPERLVKSLHIAVLVYVARRFAVNSYFSINPSIILARAFFKAFADLNFLPLQDCIYFMAGDILGVLIATWCHQYVLRIKLQARKQKEIHKLNSKQKQIELVPLKNK